MNHLRLGFALLAFAFTALAAVARDPAEVILMVHTKHQDWAKPLIDRSGRKVVLGDSIQDIKGWTLVTQFGQAKPAGGGKQPKVSIPYTLYYRDGDKAVTLAKGTVTTDAPNAKDGPEAVTNHLYGLYRDHLTVELAPQVFVGKTSVLEGKVDPARGHTVVAAGTLDRTTKPPTGTFQLHNRLPVPVLLALEVKGVTNSPIFTGEWLPIPDGVLPNNEPLVLKPGQKQTLKIPLKDFDPRHIGVQLVVRDLELQKPEEKK